MNISRKKFIIIFITLGFIFLFITTSLLGTTGTRGFPQAPDSVIYTGADSPIAWKSNTAKIIFPIKIILIGPLAIPSIDFLHDDPPPPFIGIYLIIYWTILASTIYYFINKKLKSLL